MTHYKKIMTDEEFSDKIFDLANCYKTCYLYGGFGQLITKEIINQKSKQLPNWYTQSRIDNLMSYVGKTVYGFDCVNMIKAILWGWNKGKLGTYNSNTVPDVNADSLIKLCEEVSTDMNKIQPMELIYFKGHVGLYLGVEKNISYCIECAPSLDKVAVTRMDYQNKWYKHGKLPWIAYKKNDELPTKAITNKSSINDIKWLQQKLNLFIKSGKLRGINKVLQVDGIWGALTSKAILAFFVYQGWDITNSKGYYAGTGTINALNKNDK